MSRLNDVKSGEEAKSPKFELQTSLNVVHLRTCADSCRLLMQLLTYLADDGDLDEKGVSLSEDSSVTGSIQKNGPESLAANDGSSCSGQEIESQVNDLMAEAMLESSPTTLSTNNKKVISQQRPVVAAEQECTRPTQVFFFPDENSGKVSIQQKNLPTKKESDPCRVWHEGVDNLMDDALDPTCDDIPEPEEEFCILENDPGVGFTVGPLLILFNRCY